MPKILDVIPGDPIEAVWGNQSIRDRTVQRMTSEADRDASVPSPGDGETVWVQDINELQIWDGTQWAGQGLGTFLPLAGGVMSGNIDMGFNFVYNLPNPLNPGDAVNKAYADALTDGFLPLSGGIMSGDILMGNNEILDVQKIESRRYMSPTSTNFIIEIPDDPNAQFLIFAANNSEIPLFWSFATRRWSFGSDIDFLSGFGFIHKPWTSITLQNGWTNHSGGEQSAQYRIDYDDRVYVRFTIANGVTTPGTTVFQLPVGWRPNQNMIFAGVSNEEFAILNVGSNGNCIVRGNWSPIFASFSFSFDLD